MTTPETADLERLIRDHIAPYLRYVVRRAGDRDRELVVALTDLYRETVPVPGVRSATLSLLADRGDVVALGSMTDRAHPLPKGPRRTLFGCCGN